MKVSAIILVFGACVWAATADVAHVKAAKAKFLGRLALKGKHNKRGILSAVPTFKLGHDIPLVTHSVVKPLVVTYPPTAAVAAVKIPVPNPHVPRYPVPVGHKVPGLPHPHYGLKFPHTKYLAKPDHHFHHHHHHVAPKPIAPVVPAAPPVTHVAPVAPILPAPQPTLAIAHPAPAPPPVVVPAPIFPTHPLAVSAPPAPIIPNHLHLKPLLPAAAIPFAPVPPPILPAPVFPLRQTVPYVIRPGGAVQTSVFATYPRFPFLNSYQAPLFPLAPTAPTIPQVLLERPHVHPYSILPQAHHHEVLEQHTPNVVVGQTPTLLQPTQIAPQPDVHLHSVQEPQPAFHLHSTQETLHQPAFHVHPTQETLPQTGFHLHPTQETLPQPGYHLQPTQEVLSQPGLHLHPSQFVPQASGPQQPAQPSLDHDGWSPVATQPYDLATAHEGHLPQQTHHFTQEQGTQVYEHHTENQYNDFQHQLQHHIQQQIEQAQYEQSLNNQHQPGQEYGVPLQHGQSFGQTNEFTQQGQDFAQHGQNFAQHGQDFAQHGQDFAQHGQDFAQNAQDFGHHGQDFSQNGQDFIQPGHNFGQHTQDIGQQDFNSVQPAQEYGLPQQGIEGRNADDNEQQYHNHIPLGLQPPLDRPLDHFQ